MRIKSNWPLLVILIAATVVILKHLNDGQRLLAILKQANPWLILAALITEGVYYLLFARLHQRALNLYRINWRLKETIPMVFTALLVNLFIPFGPLGSGVVFSQKARAKVASRLNATAALLLVALIDFIGLLFFLIISVVILIGKHQLLPIEIIALTILSFMIAGLILLLSGTGLNRLNRLPFPWLKQRLAYWQDLSGELKQKRRAVIATLPLSLVMHLTDLIVVALLILAFHQNLHWSNLVVSYSLLILFIVVMPTPQGLGIVETVMPLILSSWGLQIEAATLIILTFRGISFWLPAILGVFGLLQQWESLPASSDVGTRK